MKDLADVVQISPATPEMAEVASVLLHLSMHPLADYWMGTDDTPAAKAILACMFRARRNLFSYQFARCAEIDGKVAGLELSYPAQSMLRLELQTLLRFLEFGGLPTTLRMLKRSYPLQSITAAGPEEYFLAHLAVLPEYEGRGLGRQLLQHAEQRALAAGLRKITLTVDADNDGAMSLYARAGFRVTSSANLEPLRRKFGYNGYHHMEKLLA